MNRIACSCTLAIAAAFASHGRAFAQHADDIGLLVADGVLATHSVDATGLGPPMRAFASEFGGEGSPHFTTEPGFDAEAGTFAVGTRVGFRFTAPLLVWDGTALVPTDPGGALSGERLKASFLTLNAVSSDGPVQGFDLAVQPDGGWHRHLSWTLLAAPGAAEPESGAYVALLQMYSTDPTVGDSMPFAIVFNDGASEAEAQAAYTAALALVQGPPCAADLNASGMVDGADLGALLAAWGGNGPADLTGDGVVSGADLGELLTAWGACQP